MTRPIDQEHPLHRLFRGLTEATFLDEFGIGDPNLVGYLADLLARFVPNDQIWRLRDAEGRRLNLVAEMVAEAEASPNSERRRECHRPVGDFTLFWAGVYPEYIGCLRKGDDADGLIDFQRQGKRSYFLAGTVDDEQAPILRRLSVQFEICAFGLSKVRKEWERFEPPKLGDGPARLIA